MNSLRHILSAVLAFVAVQLSAQEEWMNVFRTDSTFHTICTDDVLAMTHAGSSSGGFTDLLVYANGGDLSVPLDKISKITFGHHVPEVHINLIDFPNANDLFKSSGYTKSTEYAATISINGHGVYDDVPKQEVVFRGRGNSTWLMPKTPYRFKFEKKTSVCGLKKAKSYALIANYLDESLMRNAVALWLANRFNMPFANHCVPVDVYLNNRYKGSYFLTEKIGIGSGSVDIDETTGMLFELDSNYDEDFKFAFDLTTLMPSSEASTTTPFMPVMCKDPDLIKLMAQEVDPEKAANDYWEKWVRDISQMFTAVMTCPADESLARNIDLISCVDYFLVQAITNNHECCHPKSMFLYKTQMDPDAKYVFGPLWDFDWSFTYSGKSDNPYYLPLVNTNGAGAVFMKKLFANNEFMSLFNERFEEFLNNDYDELLDFVDDYARKIEPSATMNGLRWPHSEGSYWIANSSYNHSAAVQKLRAWIVNRIQYMQRHKNRALY